MAKKSSLPRRVGLIGCGNISNAYFQAGRKILLKSKCRKPDAMPVGLPVGKVS
jgi:hypothetical protein